MNRPSIASSELRAILRSVALDMGGHMEELRALDAALGDGDLGVTIQLASRAIEEGARETDDGEADDIGMLFARLAMSINKVSPSTFGTLLASAFLGAAAPVKGKTSVGPEDLLAMGRGAVEGVKKRGKADVGDKTMLDSLVPAVEAYGKALTDGAGAPQALAAAVDASDMGMQATSAMTAKFGRASWRREESEGVCDAGAAAMYYLILSFCGHASDFVSSAATCRPQAARPPHEAS